METSLSDRQDIIADTDFPDPTCGYFLIFASPPPDVRNLPDGRTAVEAMAATKEAAQKHGAVVHLRHYTETTTLNLGSATPDGVFHFVPQLRKGNFLTPQELDFLQRKQQEVNAHYPDSSHFHQAAYWRPWIRLPRLCAWTKI